MRDENNHYRIGIDLGGTKIEGVVLDADGASVCAGARATPHGDYDGTLAAIAALVERTGTGGSAGGAGRHGMPGAISPATGLVKNSNSVLPERPAAARRPRTALCNARCASPTTPTASPCPRRSMARRPVPASCSASSSAPASAAASSSTADWCTGPQRRSPGEWGHNPLPWPQADESPGAPCYCGRQGCIETWLSGPGLARDHHAVAGVEATAAVIAARAAAGEAAAQATLERYADRMARALASVINIIDPDVIVLGGGMSNIESLYKDVPQRWGAYVFSDRVDTRLVRARHGDSSGVRGAAWLWPANGAGT